MAAAAVAQNNAPSPHSSASSSPQTQTSRLPPNTPLYTQEDVLRFVQAALATACREQGIHPQTRTPSAQVLQEERVMKPRVHMYETFGAKRMMLTTLELPGLQKNDVSITARPNGDLVISGERRPQHLLYLSHLRGRESENEQRQEERPEESGRTVFNELKFGKFQRVIRLPTGTDPTTITASMDDGMLTICWPLPPITHPSQQRVHRSNADEDTQMKEADSRRSSL